ncbi:MAG: SRPBCC family protein [Ilumatobacteraceae bacterium]
MTLTAAATVFVEATPREILELVVDLHRYREVDPKILRVVSVVGPDEAGRGTVRLWARMKGLPPAPDRQDFVLERWRRVTFTGAGRQPARLIFDFVGVVECSPGEHGATMLTHRYEFDFRRPFRFVERRLAGWLQRQIDDELHDLAAHLSSAR